MDSATAVTIEEPKALELSERALLARVVDQGTHDNACEDLRAIADLRRMAEEHHRPVIKAAHGAWQAALAALARIDDPLAKAERWLKTQIGAWQTEQKRIEEARQRQARLEEEQRRQAEADRIRREAEEQERIRLEEAERILQATEQAGATTEEVTAFIDQVERENQAAQDAISTQLEQLKAAPMPLPAAVPAFVPSKGVSSRVAHEAQVTSVKALCREIAEGRQPESLVLPNMTALNAMARALKTALRIPGVTVVEKTITSSRSAR